MCPEKSGGKGGYCLHTSQQTTDVNGDSRGDLGEQAPQEMGSVAFGPPRVAISCVDRDSTDRLPERDRKHVPKISPQVAKELRCRCLIGTGFGSHPGDNDGEVKDETE